MGALLRKNDARRRVRQFHQLYSRRRRCETSGQISHGSGRRSAAAPMPVMCVDQAAHPEDVGGPGNEVFSGELLLRGKTGAPGSDARHFRSWLSQLYPGQIADFEVARRLQSPAGRRFLTAKIPQRAAQSRYATHSSPSRNHAQRPEQMGPGAVSKVKSQKKLKSYKV